MPPIWRDANVGTRARAWLRQVGQTRVPGRKVEPVGASAKEVIMAEINKLSVGKVLDKLRRDDAPTFGKAYPALLLATVPELPGAAELGRGGGEIAAECRDDGIADDPSARRDPRAAKGGDLLVSIERLGEPEAQGVGRVAEQLVEHRDIVAVERLLIAHERRCHLADDLRQVDFRFSQGRAPRW